MACRVVSRWRKGQRRVYCHEPQPEQCVPLGGKEIKVSETHIHRSSDTVKEGDRKFHSPRQPKKTNHGSLSKNPSINLKHCLSLGPIPHCYCSPSFPCKLGLWLQSAFSQSAVSGLRLFFIHGFLFRFVAVSASLSLFLSEDAAPRVSKRRISFVTLV